MSDDIKESAGAAGDITHPAGSPLFNLVVKCYRDVYRRAGIPFKRGENTVVGVTEEQVRIIERDSVLKIISGSPASQPEKPGAVDHVGMDRELGVDGPVVDDLNARILLAVAGLDKSNTELFTTSGAPKVAAVCAALGKTITGAQLNAALAEPAGDA